MFANMTKTTAQVNSNFEIFVDIENAVSQSESHLVKKKIKPC